MGVGLEEDVEAAQVLLDEGVEVGGVVAARVELAQQVGEHAHVRKLLHVAATQIKVVVDVVDPVGVQFVRNAGERCVHVPGLRLGRGVLDVRHSELGQRGQRLRRVRGLLLGAQGLHLGGYAGELPVAHGGAARLELGRLLGGVALLDGHEVDLGRVRVLAHQLA